MAIKTTVGIKNRLYKNDISSTNNTTIGFGIPQPLYMRTLLKKGHSVQAQIKQFLRLAPMPYPTLADIRLKNVVRFVPMEDVDPLFSARLSQQSVILSDGRTVTPNKQLTVTNDVLWKFLVQCSDTKISVCNMTNGTVSAADAIELSSAFDITVQPSQLTDTLTVYSADYVYQPVISESTCYFFRLGQKGRILADVFRGLGYNPEFGDTQELCFLPIMAYHKAIFDEFNPGRTKQYQNTRIYRLIKQVENAPDTLVTITSSSTNQAIIEEILEVYATEGLNFHSLHTQGAVNPSSEIAPSDFSSSDGGLNTLNINKFTNGIPVLSQRHTNITEVLTKPYLDLLRHFTHIVNKDSIIGKNLKKWLEIRYGSEVMNSLFQDTLRVAQSEIAVSIDDIFSTSETKSPDGGDYLGAFAGKGVGSNAQNPFNFTFKAPSAGFLIVFTYIQPLSRFYNGTNPQLLLRDYNTYPQLEYDAVGYEVTPMTCLADNNDVTGPVKFTESFGYLPRYTGYKLSMRRDIVNGALRRRSTASAFDAYYLSKQILSAQYFSQSFVGGGSGIVSQSNTIPKASEEWRYIAKYPWLSNYNRMFYNSGRSVIGPSSELEYGPQLGSNEPVDDNFVLHTVINATENSPLKPIGMSYDTICENDNATTQVANV